jgi:hypothetical protein
MISLSEFDDSIGLGIPYPPDLHNGGGNAGYFDLKKEPEKISDIHELKNWPELRDFVTLINHKDSFFRTLRCQVFFSGVPVNLPFKRVCFSYTTVAFEILDYNLSMGCHEELRQGIAKYATESLSESGTHMELDLTSTSYNEHRVSRAWSLTINVWGFGQENEEARETWAVGIRALYNFFAKECFAYPGELKKGRLTVS